MNKGLEALESIRKMFCPHWSLENYKIIEKELKRLEEIDDILNTGGGIWAENGTVSKKLEALEILKDFPLDLVEEDNRFYITSGSTRHRITQEEYDLLNDIINRKS